MGIKSKNTHNKDESVGFLSKRHFKKKVNNKKRKKEHTMTTSQIAKHKTKKRNEQKCKQ